MLLQVLHYHHPFQWLLFDGPIQWLLFAGFPPLFQGGIKAVIWTDTIQMVILLVGLIVLSVMGADKAGGIHQAWNITVQGGRNNFIEYVLSLTTNNASMSK